MIVYAKNYRAFSHVERFGIGVIIYCFDYEDIPMLDTDANRTLVHQLQEGGHRRLSVASRILRGRDSVDLLTWLPRADLLFGSNGAFECIIRWIWALFILSVQNANLFHSVVVQNVLWC